ncbi:hypothetical protein RUM44_010252 [Polyplax serrata]|uniref:Uncharacterized protein n=1 Tax=Polyplax serrata TaxID=468196 RepID=A0ABR1AWI5_POLSC
MDITRCRTMYAEEGTLKMMELPRDGGPGRIRGKPESEGARERQKRRKRKNEALIAYLVNESRGVRWHTRPVNGTLAVGETTVKPEVAEGSARGRSKFDFRQNLEFPIDASVEVETKGNPEGN